MLYIDNKKFEIIDHNIFLGEYIKNGEKGYCVNMHLSFINIETGEKGYINLDVGFEKNNNINNFLNKEYMGIPFEDDIFFEVFDTKKFLDSEIESNITFKLKELMNNKVETFFELNDELIKIKFNDFLNYVLPNEVR